MLAFRPFRGLPKNPKTPKWRAPLKGVHDMQPGERMPIWIQARAPITKRRPNNIQAGAWITIELDHLECHRDHPANV